VPDLFEQSCIVTNGRIPIEISKTIADVLKRVESGKRIVISVRKHVKTRSNNQNRAYWGLVVPRVLEMFLEAGNDTTPEEIHEYLKEHVGGGMFARVLVDPDGKRRPVVRSSTTLTTQEWEDFMTRIRAWAAERGVDIPEPNEHLVHHGE
jgi:hypothetical protein